MDIYKKIDELQSWIQENQVRASDEQFKEKVTEMQALIKQAYNFN